jgi:uncharacterized cupredoxin-like copper-binding protein
MSTGVTRALAGAGAVMAAVAALGVLAVGTDAGARSDGPVVLGPGVVTVELGIEHSAFDTTTIQVRQGTQVRFVLTNRDPILHELIVGPPEVHRRHEAGTEASHPPRPGEVTVEPLAGAETTYDFADAGVFEFACHLPRHRAYGMTGTVEVVPA